eukprot:Gb_32920 [translate_table: standard]
MGTLEEEPKEETSMNAVGGGSSFGFIAILNKTSPSYLYGKTILSESLIFSCFPRMKDLYWEEVLAYVSQVHKVTVPDGIINQETLTLDQIESNIARCPDPVYAEKMIDAIDAVRTKGDSVGGVVTCIVRNVPKGLGSPVFDKLEAELANALMSLPATKGFEIGSGFAGTLMTGSEHNDEFYMDDMGEIRTRTNRSGGIQGGISNGETIILRVAFKPTSTITCQDPLVADLKTLYKSLVILKPSLKGLKWLEDSDWLGRVFRPGMIQSCLFVLRVLSLSVDGPKHEMKLEMHLRVSSRGCLHGYLNPNIELEEAIPMLINCSSIQKYAGLVCHSMAASSATAVLGK